MTESTLTPELAIRLATATARLDVAADNPVTAGTIDGVPVVFARPPFHPDVDLRVCEGLVWQRVERVPIELEADPDGEVHQRYRVQLVPAEAGDAGAELHQCGTPLAGKRRQARYCDECAAITRNVDTKRRLRASKRRERQLDATDEILVDYLERVEGSAARLDDLRHELSEVPERQRAAIVDAMAGGLDAKTTDPLADPLPLSDAYVPPEPEGQGSDDLQPHLDEPARSADLAARDVRWCTDNHVAGWRYPCNPPGSLGFVRRTHAYGPRKGSPRLRHALDASRDAVWRVRLPRVLPPSFRGERPVDLYEAHARRLRGADWDAV